MLLNLWLFVVVVVVVVVVVAPPGAAVAPVVVVDGAAAVLAFVHEIDKRKINPLRASASTVLRKQRDGRRHNSLPTMYAQFVIDTYTAAHEVGSHCVPTRPTCYGSAPCASG